MPDTQYRSGTTGGGTAQDPPFPETGYSPALQRTLKEKFDRGENPSVDKETFFKALGRAAHPKEESSSQE